MDPTSSADIKTDDLVVCHKDTGWGCEPGKYFIVGREAPEMPSIKVKNKPSYDDFWHRKHHFTLLLSPK